MAASLQVAMASLVPPSTSSPIGRRGRGRTVAGGGGGGGVRCSAIGSKGSSKLPLPPINPKDPFLSKLASVAAASPESLLDRPASSDTPPYLDLFESPQLMATPAQVERSVSYNEHGPRRPLPDLPSLLLHGIIVYIDMPLVPAVMELVIAELMYLQWMDPNEPIYLYINSTGTTRDDVAVGAAIGHACLILASGSKAMIQQPRVPSSGLMPASDVLIHAKEVINNRDTLVKLLAKHTGNSIETVATVMRRPYLMDATKAREFGVIGKILWRVRRR